MKKSEATRLNILQKAFELIYIKGYQTTSIDEIIATTQVTKGAFYYHFKTKDEMGVAIINELLKPTFTKTFVEPLLQSQHPLDSIYKLMHEVLMDNEFLKVEYGCPASNFTQEMAPWNITFTKALNDLSEQWENAMIVSINNAKGAGTVKPTVNAKEIAIFVMSGYWGVRNLGKLENSKSVYLIYLKGLKAYFDSLQ
ncbi:MULTISPECIES: TetR/AcrR family transcriptional regulator [Chryseobacterium]|jgi:AcrR family transcriptional regulator|uniref:TetR/AcrR family transcriptional regulator n=1 Tax=Chryseobacterium rhizosphaerae TaxID=395937 RepID=A0ABX9IN18_9FLAO|nr:MULTISPECIES: TetR/AcrR family transcriptional regulator [Chryseobacterium]REC76257.1 TetR/AcrR family transcriptional regulator [Chryseobacterium rhizosphaerae]GEN65888.1 TetR family transcriptional regulator [Chryseobacterium rhizosphaerae]SMC36414.1 transcriptional regulator, TetR family [Chryseobacterium sp. YR221]